MSGLNYKDAIALSFMSRSSPLPPPLDPAYVSHPPA